MLRGDRENSNYTLEEILTEIDSVHKKSCRSRLLFRIDKQKNPIELSISGLEAHIAFLCKQDFTCDYEDRDGTSVLVKDLVNIHKDNLHPIHRREADIQLYRYLRGLCLIAANFADRKMGDDLMIEIEKIHRYYVIQLKTIDKSITAKADLVLYIIDKLANILATILYPDTLQKSNEDNQTQLAHAMRQITMARDLGILLEEHPPVVTVTETPRSGIISAEKSTLIRVSERFYSGRDSRFANIHYQPWFESAKEMAGIPIREKQSWLDNFFEKNLSLLKQYGIPATPSARWLPIPANTQHMEIITCRRDHGKIKLIHHNDFIRSGVIIPYDIRSFQGEKPYDYQKDIATELIKATIRSLLREKIAKFKQLYHIQEGEEFNFPINYQTLLSPLRGERYFGHIDNNARFVVLVKNVIEALNLDVELKNEFKDTGAILNITHTNSAINSKAPLTINDMQDKKTRQKRIEAFRKYQHDLVVRYSDGYHSFIRENPILANELKLRKMACDLMEGLLKREFPYRSQDLKAYQCNLIMAALDHLSMGSQGLSIDGCKSARDRFAIFSCAVKVMQENHQAMENWAILEDGIVRALLQGHYFRSMNYHSGIVKVDLVHDRFMAALPPDIQIAIKKLLVFSKNLATDAPLVPLAQVNKHNPVEKKRAVSSYFFRTKEASEEDAPKIRVRKGSSE